MKLLRAFTFAVFASLAATALGAETRPPNVVFLFADDFGWGDLGCYGHPYAKTPHLDRLASEGTRFLQCYATGVTCCPSRTGFMTSKFPATFAKYPAGAGFGDRVTITDLLKKRGYAIGHFGKWHIGAETKDGTYGIDEVGTDEKLSRPRRNAAPSDRGRDAYIFDAAIQFIEKHKDQPFYVNVWGHISHHPINPSPAVREAFGALKVDESKFPPEMQEKFTTCKKLGGDVSEHMRAFLADVKSMDDDVGRLLQRLDELGLRENTIVVFSSDQGPAPLRETIGEPKRKKNKQKTANADVAELRLNAMGFAGPFRGGKHTQYEGGVRIPFIVRWPSRVLANHVDEKSVISGADWLPTLCSIAEVKIETGDFDGEDASASWFGQAPHVRTKPLIWKTSSLGSDPAMREGQWKFHGTHRRSGEVALYDLAADPAERNNIAAQHPEVVKKLSAKLEAWVATLPKEYVKTADKED